MNGGARYCCVTDRITAMSRPIEFSKLKFNGDVASPPLLQMRETSKRGFHQTEKTQMTTFRIKTRKIKVRTINTFGVALLLSAAVAAPAFAEGAAPRHIRAYGQSSFEQLNGAPYDNAPLTRQERINQQNFGFSGHCPSCVGGEDPALNPAS
jgi:hypothetical protein